MSALADTLALAAGVASTRSPGVYIMPRLWPSSLHSFQSLSTVRNHEVCGESPVLVTTNFSAFLGALIDNFLVRFFFSLEFSPSLASLPRRLKPTLLS
jgi:hypothetical protein